MKNIFWIAILACTAVCAADTFAQSAGRSASGEKRMVDKKSDVGAYEILKSHVNKELNTVVSTADSKIIPFRNEVIPQIKKELEDLAKVIDELKGSLHPENDPSIIGPRMANNRPGGLNGGIPVCNTQTEEIYFEKSTGRWSCEAGASGCMASQNVWR